jgi:hypothetical protein
MDINEILNNISIDLTREIRSIIRKEGLIRTGLLVNSILVEVAYVPMISKSGFVVSYDAPYYWQYLDGNYRLTEQLKNTTIYKNSKDNFKSFLDGTYDLDNTTAKGLKGLIGDVTIANIKTLIADMLL